MTDVEARSIRELGGEIWAEVGQTFPDDVIEWQTKNELADLVMGVLARYDGYLLMNDRDVPVTPLPHRAG